MERSFYNDGFGWVCSRCQTALDNGIEADRPSRLMREGEAESKQPELSNKALAQWVDNERITLRCPRCGTIGPAH